MKVITCLLPFLLSCGAMPESKSELRVINANVVKVDHIVELSPVGCTGTVVGLHTMITAGHCYKTGTTSSFNYKGKTYKALMERNPKYADNEATNDQSIGYIRDELPPPYGRINALPLSVGQTVELNGYGCIRPKSWWGGGANGADHQLRRGLAKIVSISSLEFTTRGGAAICFGDSGGPVTLQDTLDVVGINSKGNIRDTSWLERLDTKDFMNFAKSYSVKNETEINGLSFLLD